MEDYRIFGGRGAGMNIKRLITGIARENPGALAFCCELAQLENGVDYINTLGMLELFGSRAYQLWNDCCDRNTEQAAEVLRLFLENKITKEEIHEHTDLPRGTAFDMDELRAREPQRPKEGYLKARHGIILPGKVPAGTCEECATMHDPRMPHNQQSLAYQYKFYDQHGRFPTWADAMAHCDEEMQQYWTNALRERGITV